MNYKQRQARFKALAGVRWEVKGWAFMNADRLPSVIAHAESVRNKLPVELQAGADEIIAPLKQALMNLALENKDASE